MDDLEKVLMNELKSDLVRRAQLLLAQNPDWAEFLNPLLDELEITNLSIEYLQEKLIILKELQNENVIERDYKEELKNMCIYLKTEIEEGQIILEDTKKQTLIDIITNNIDLINNTDIDINWEEKLKEFNCSCENLYLS